MAYEPRDNETELVTRRRAYFIEQLTKKGIEHEITDKVKDENGKWKPVFVKLHATLKFLYSYAEKMAIHMDLKNSEDLKQLENEAGAESDDELDDDDDGEESADYVEIVMNYVKKVKENSLT